MSQVLESQDIRALGSNLELLAQQVVEGFIVGLHRSPFHGFSVEFAEHRLYNAGESTRNIDWKVYGRTDKLFTKKFEEETNLRCQIVLDASSTMYYPVKLGRTRRNSSTKTSFVLPPSLRLCLWTPCANSATHSDSPSSTTTSGSIRLRNPARYTTGCCFRTWCSASKTPNLITRPTSQPVCTRRADATIHRRLLVVIFTDVMEQPGQAEEIFAALQHLRYAKHEVILFHVTDKSKEPDFEFEKPPLRVRGYGKRRTGKTAAQP